MFAKACDLFNLNSTVTLYDLTNTYFEGEFSHNAKVYTDAPRKPVLSEPKEA